MLLTFDGLTTIGSRNKARKKSRPTAAEETKN
jgi:hypothetical protein